MEPEPGRSSDTLDIDVGQRLLLDQDLSGNENWWCSSSGELSIINPLRTDQNVTLDMSLATGGNEQFEPFD
jgi:hypothetical protein